MKQDGGHIWVKGLLFKTVDYDPVKHSFILESTNEIRDYDVANPINYRSFTCFKYSDEKIHLIKNLL